MRERAICSARLNCNWEMIPVGNVSNPSTRTGLEKVKTNLRQFESVAAVKMSVRAHYEHLECLTEKLRQIGMEEKTIDEHVIALFGEYKAELTKTIAGL